MPGMGHEISGLASCGLQLPQEFMGRASVAGLNATCMATPRPDIHLTLP